MAVLLAAPLACCRFELTQRRMIPPSNFALRIVVEEEPKLVRRLNAQYADAETMPRSGDMGATRRYMADLQRAMIKAMWSVDFFAVA